MIFRSFPINAFLAMFPFNPILSNNLKLLYNTGQHSYISGQCSHFIAPENNRKLLVFWCF